MSKFKDLFKQECKELVIEEPIRPLVCPTCVPNIAAPKINWIQQDEPYFDERTCEYSFNFLAPNKVQDIGDNTLQEYVQKVKVYGAAYIFEHFNKEKPKGFKIFENTAEEISYIKTSMDNVLVDPSNMIRIKISIDAVFFDKLKEKATPLDESPPEESSDFPSEILISDMEADFSLDFETIMLGLTGFELRQAFFSIEKGALLREDNEDKFVAFKYKNLKNNIKQFRKQLDKLLNLNGYKLLSIFNFFSFDKVVTKLRITLDNSDEKSPLKIDKVFVEFENCPETELLKGIAQFKNKANLKDAIFFMANYDNILNDLTATETRDWLEFTKDYVYPPIFVDYGDNPEDTQIVDSGLKCAAIDFDEILKNILNDLAIDPWSILSAEFDKQSCNPDLKKSNPTVKQFYNPKAQQEFVKAYEKELRKLKEKNKPLLKEYATLPDRNENETEQDYQKRIALIKEEKEQFLKDLDARAQSEAYQKIKKEQIDNPQKYSFEKLLEDEYKRQKKKKDEDKSSILEIFKRIQEESDSLLEGDLFEKFTNTVGLCGINEGMGIALDCLLKQVTFEDAINAAIKVAFETLPPAGLEDILLFGLDPLKQEELKTKVATKLGRNSAGEIPWPWENPVSDQKRKQNAALRESVEKQYIVDLQVDIDNGDEEATRILEQEKQIQLNVLKTQGRRGDLEKIAESFAYETLAKRQANKQLSRQATDVTESTNEIFNSILDAYVEAIFELLSIDELIELFYSVPAVKLIVDLFKSFIKCPTKVIHEFQQNKIIDFKLDICNPLAPVIDFKIPNIEFQNPILLIEENFVQIIRQAIAKVLSYAIKLFLDFLEDALCSALELLGKLALNPDEFFANLDDVLRKAFCPDASLEEAKNLGNNLLNKIGATDDDVSDAIDCLGGALAGSFTQEELVSLMVDENPSEDLIRRVSNAIMIGCPRMADLFGNPNQTRNAFGNFRDLIPEDVRDRMEQLRGVPNAFSDTPLYETICLTSEELEEWDEYRRGLLESAGLNPDDASQQVENYNRRAKEALEDVLRNLSETPDGSGLQQAMRDAIGDLLAPNEPRPPGCDLDEGESNYGSKAISEPKDIVRMQDELSDRIMNYIGEQFNREFSNNPNPFFPSLISRIMRDTEGNDYSIHSLWSNFFFTRMDYHNSTNEEQKKEAGEWYQKTFGLDDIPFMGEDRGYYPQTVGNDLKTQIIENREYKNNPSTPVNYIIPFNLPEELTDDKLLLNGNYGSVSYASVKEQQNLNRVFDYNSYRTVSEYDSGGSCVHVEKIEIEPDVLSLVEGLNIDGNFSRTKIFESFISKQLTGISTIPDIDYEIAFGKFCEKVFNETSKMTVEDSQGFVFGFEEEDLTKEELNYVDPEEGSTEYTKLEEEKILGRAQTPSDRVFFLNPDEFGGSYKVPPVYIVPKRNIGWKKIASVLSPEEEPCEPKSENILKFSEIKERASQVRNSMNVDPRISKSIDKCFTEKPFDKILNKNATGGVDSISKMHIRMAIVVTLATSIPAMTNVKFDDKNYDNFIVEAIYQKLFTDLMEVNPFGPRTIEMHKYTMLVFEQIIQSFERDVIKNLPPGDIGGHDVSELPEEIREAYISLNAIREEYNYLSIEPYPDKKKFDTLAEGQELLNNGLLFPYALAYSKYGEMIFSDDFSFQYDPPLILGNPPTPVLPPWVDWKLYCKILAIRMGLKDMKVIIKEEIKKEMEKVLEGMYEQLPEKIKDINKYLLTSKVLFAESTVENIGTKFYSDATNLGSFVSVGDTAEVLDSVEEDKVWETTSSDFEDDEVVLKLEKYFRVTKKLVFEDETLQAEIDEIIENNDGVVSFENLENLIESLKGLQNEELFISDVLGDATILPEDPSKYLGTIGIKQGLRIVMRLPKNSVSFPEDIASSLLTEAEKNLSRFEKSYLSGFASQINSDGVFKNLSIPICSVELDLKDQKVSDFSIREGENQYDLNCLLEKISETTEYKLFFKYLAPTKAVTSMIAAYSNSFFIPSIGVDDGWTDEAGIYKKKKNDIEGMQLKETNLICRKYFCSFYDSTKFNNSENWRLPKIEIPDFFSLLFGSFKIPNISLSLDLLLPDFAFDHKIIQENPLNKDKEICATDVDKFIN